MDGSLDITVANDGLLPLDVELVVKSGREIQSTTLESLSAGEQTWTMPLPARHRTQKVDIALTARSAVGTAEGPTQVEAVTLHVKRERVSVIKGRLEPFVELSDGFDGWYADPVRWDTPEYHLGPPLLYEAAGSMTLP